MLKEFLVSEKTIPLSSMLQSIEPEKKYPTEQMSLEFVNDNAISIDRGVIDSLLKEMADYDLNSEELPPAFFDLSSNEKQLFKLEQERKNTLEKNKKIKESHCYTTLYSLNEDQVEELRVSKHHLDYIKLEYNGKKYKNLFITKDHLREINKLKENFPNFSKVVDYILTHAFFCHKKNIPFFLPAINLNGDPSIGKTFFAKSLAKALYTDFFELPISTLISSHELTGLSQYWGNANTGLLFNYLVKKAEYAQSIILLDEICKVSFNNRTNNGSNLSNALISLMDKQQAKKIVETCLDIEIDMSRALVLSTSNEIETIPNVLRSRIVNFNIESPSKEHLEKIIQSMVNHILEELQISRNEMEIRITRETSDLFYGKDLRDAREVLKNHIMQEYMERIDVAEEKPYQYFH